MKITRRFAAQCLLLGFAALSLSGCSYNKFVSQEEAVKAQWAQVENQLQRRNDLIPNLVETVKGYATHERKRVQGDRRLAIAPAGRQVAGGKHRRGQSADVRARPFAGRRRKLPQPQSERTVQPADGRTIRH